MKDIVSFEQLDLTKQYTYADYLTWRFDEAVELIKGFVYKMSPAPSTRHQTISGKFHAEFYNFLKKQPCKVFHAPFDVRLHRQMEYEKTTTVVQPDICVICDPSILDERGCNGAPDLIIEILSPATSRKDVKFKFESYQEAGVKEYWIVDPLENLLDQFILKEGKYHLVKKFVSDDVVEVITLPGLSIDLQEIFE